MFFRPLALTPLIGVFDMIASLRLYRDLLGFEVISASPEVDTREGRFSHWMWLKRGAAEIMLNTQFDSNDRPHSADPARRAAHADTAFYFACPDIDAAYRELKERGLLTEPPHTAPYGARLFSCTDPDGYTIVFQQVPQAPPEIEGSDSRPDRS
jgi:uncharacterized glyoxalase superfamily protein PhnB